MARLAMSVLRLFVGRQWRDTVTHYRWQRGSHVLQPVLPNVGQHTVAADRNMMARLRAQVCSPRSSLLPHAAELLRDAYAVGTVLMERWREAAADEACAYEKRSVAVSSNVHPAGFDELMPKTLATATVDRLLHHAHLCITSGDSVRLAQATAGKGVMPLATPN